MTMAVLLWETRKEPAKPSEFCLDTCSSVVLRLIKAKRRAEVSAKKNSTHEI